MAAEIRFEGSQNGENVSGQTASVSSSLGGNRAAWICICHTLLAVGKEQMRLSVPIMNPT
jgi:hypothetical protein